MADFKLVSLITGCWFIIIFSIWCGCFFGIYFPFLRDFKPATCTYKDSMEFYSSPEHGGDPLYHYRQLLMNVQIGDKVYTGMGCESDSYRLSTVEYDSPWGAYAYQYIYCNQWSNSSEYDCPNQQEVQARWLCEDWADPSKFQPGEEYECWYAVMNSYDDVEEADLYKKYPHGDEAYLEVIFQDSPYYPRAEYLVLQILCLGILCLLPFTCLLFVCLPGLCDFQPYILPCKACYYCFYKCIWKRGILRAWRYCRRRVCVCIPYYDPNLVVDNRAMLFSHAFSYSKQLRIKARLARSAREYMA